MQENETERLEEVYKERREKNLGARYSLFQKGTLQQVQERERVLLRMLEKSIGTSVADKRILDIGCGNGGTLLPMLGYGFRSENCFGIDLQADRINHAKKKLPNMTFVCCSAENIPFEKNTFDLVTMFTCLSSVLDINIRESICHQAREMLCPGGWVLVYDFYVNNPNNSDVKAVKLNELKSYFPGYRCHSKRLTLLPPLSRRLAKYSMALCTLLGSIPLLRTHRLTMFQKPLQ